MRERKRRHDDVQLDLLSRRIEQLATKLTRQISAMLDDRLKHLV